MLSVCNAIDDSGLDRLAATVTTHKVDAQRPLVVEGERADALLNITEGTVKVYKLLADGRQQITGFLFAGDFVGLSSNESYVYSAEAITAVSYCRFPRRQLERLLDDFPQMEHRLLRFASNELAAAQNQMLLLGRKTAREKLASFLLLLSRQAERIGGMANPVQLPMTRRDIADYLGLTIETVSRTFTQLRTERMIEVRRTDEVDLIGRAQLEDLAGTI
jgi:CRP/FNR family transcriptional regulator, anaerobic regulatory protein